MGAWSYSSYWKIKRTRVGEFELLCCRRRHRAFGNYQQFTALILSVRNRASSEYSRMGGINVDAYDF